MTAQEIIARLKADVELLKYSKTPHNDEWWERADSIRHRFTELLYDIEKVCPRLQDDQIIQKAKSEKQRVLITETDGSANVFWDARSLDDVKALLLCGLDFIKKQSKEQPLCEDFDLESDRFFRKLPLRANTPPIPDEYIDEETFDRIARHFAQWQKEKDDKELSEKIAAAYQLGLADKEKQMMKEAVEGVVSLQFADGTGAVRTTDGFVLNGLRCGQKVPIIIVKED